MKTNFEQYNSRSDKELIELSMGNSIDASMAHNVLEYRKYRETKQLNRRSFWLAITVGLFALIQLLIAIFNFRDTSPLFVQMTLTFTPLSATQTPLTPTPIDAIQPTMSSANIIVLKQPLSFTTINNNGMEVSIKVETGTNIIVTSRDKSPSNCTAGIFLVIQSPSGVIEINGTVPLTDIGESC